MKHLKLFLLAAASAALVIQPVPARWHRDRRSRRPVRAALPGLSQRPTQVVVFGNPKVGTRLMQDRQSAAIDLPLRISVWQDARNRVWVGYQNMDPLGASYGIKDKATLTALDKFTSELVGKSANVYSY